MQNVAILRTKHCTNNTHLVTLQIIPLAKKKKDVPVLQVTTRKQTRKQKLAERNYKIFSDFQKGITVQELMEKYKLSQRSIYGILNQRNEENKEWTLNMPTKTAEGMHEVMAREVWVEIEELKAQRRDALSKGELGLAMGATDKIIGHITKYDSMIVNGITLSRIKRVTLEARRIINSGKLNRK